MEKYPEIIIIPKSSKMKKRRLLVIPLILVLLISTVMAVAYLYYEWQLTLTASTPEVQFFKWADSTNATTIDLPYNVYADAWVKDDNATHGIRNWAGEAKTVDIWFESVIGATYVANVTVFVMDEDGSTTLAMITTDGTTNLGESNSQSWSASNVDTTIDTLRIWIKGAGTVDAVTVNLGMKTLE